MLDGDSTALRTLASEFAGGPSLGVSRVSAARCYNSNRATGADPNSRPVVSPSRLPGRLMTARLPRHVKATVATDTRPEPTLGATSASSARTHTRRGDKCARGVTGGGE